VNGPSDSPVHPSELLTDPAALSAHIRRALSAHPHRDLPLPPGVRRAAVLIPLLHTDDGAALLLTMRTDEVERHKGQISFPGGGVEDGESLLDAALRETYEEIGVRPEDVDILGGLDEEETAISGFRVTPFVGLIPYPNRLRLSAHEVRAILRVPLHVLLDPHNVRTEIWDRRGRPTVIYFYTAGREVIWGATARIIARFLEAVFGVPLRSADGS